MLGEPEHDPSARRILLVESSRTQLQLARHLLTELGYNVACTQSGSEAIDLIEREPFDTIVASWELPNVSGIALIETLQSHPEHRWIPVVLLTAHLDRARVRVALGAGAADFLRKPIDPLELEARLIAALRTRDLYEQLRSLATRDPLTGLLNRRAFMDRFEVEIERANRHQKPISVGMVDLDHFKQINDVRGHAAGDHVLREVARIWSQAARTSDILARYGGEEFVIVLVETGPSEAIGALDRVRVLIETHPFEVDGDAFSVTLSAGVAGVDVADDTSPEGLLRLADTALYAAKTSGRNQVR